MAMNPRARRGRSGAHRNPSGPRPPSSSADPRRRPSRAKHRPDRPSTDDSTPMTTPTALDSVLDDFTQSWERGERPRAERYLDRLRFEDSAELIYAEYCLAESSDLIPDPADYLRRFPDHVDRLSRLFALHGAVSSTTLRDWAEPAELPSTGDGIGPYQLLRELGRGAFARVFLAEQADLDHRLVVVKVSTKSTAEPQLLARARHPHIVEVLRHATTDDGGLHLVCMPFLGGATLASVLDARRAIGRPGRSGRDLLADLDRVSAPEFPSAELVRPAREVLAGLTHPKALAWIVARLAEALDHAYARGVAHGDLKPSNILLTAEATPLLLDMNLSTDHRADLDGRSGDLGGTLAYMAPERLKAIARAGGGPTSKAPDRHRADLYALGLVLLEALTGKAPEAPRGGPKDPRDLARAMASLRLELPGPLRGRGHRSIPPALRSILAKCLAPDPLDRHARGNELAEDLDLWRSDRPLAFAEEPRRSILARRARQRRSPLIGVALTLVAAVAVSLVASIVMKGSRRDEALAKYREIVDRADSGAFGFRRVGQWRDEDPVDPADSTARQLARYNVLADPDWRSRDDVRSLPDRERGELEAWLLEQVLRHAEALRQHPQSPDSWRRGLDLMEKTLARSASSTLQAERVALLGRLGLPVVALPADRPTLPRWTEEYLAGVAAEPLHAREALDHHLESLRERPGQLWAQYRAAAAACRIGEYQVAVDQFRLCVDRSPENPALRLHLASSLCYVERETPQFQGARPYVDALAECNRAVELAPDYAMAYRVRSWIRKASGWAGGVQADIDRHSSLTGRRGQAPSLGLDFELKFQPGANYARQPSNIQDLARKILENDPSDLGTRATLGAMMAMDHQPAAAIAEFDRVLNADPGHLRARYQRASQLLHLDPADAIAELASVIDSPRFEELLVEEPMAYRAAYHVANDLMGRGKIAEALDVANRILVHVNRSRTLGLEAVVARQRAGNQFDSSPRGEIYYLLARLHAAGPADSGRLGRVVENLEIAFRKHETFRKKWFAKDHHFDDLRAEILDQIPPTMSNP